MTKAGKQSSWNLLTHSSVDDPQDPQYLEFPKNVGTSKSSRHVQGIVHSKPSQCGATPIGAVAWFPSAPWTGIAYRNSELSHESIDWFKGKITGKSHTSWENL